MGTIVALITTVTAIAVTVLMVTALQARDFLFATTYARQDVITLQIAANNPLICIPPIPIGFFLLIKFTLCLTEYFGTIMSVILLCLKLEYK